MLYKDRDACYTLFEDLGNKQKTEDLKMNVIKNNGKKLNIWEICKIMQVNISGGANGISAKGICVNGDIDIMSENLQEVQQELFEAVEHGYVYVVADLRAEKNGGPVFFALV